MRNLTDKNKAGCLDYLSSLTWIETLQDEIIEESCECWVIHVLDLEIVSIWCERCADRIENQDIVSVVSASQRR